MERKEEVIVTLEEPVEGGKFIATVQGSVVTIQAQTIETYASLALPADLLDTFWAFLGRVLQDPSVASQQTGEPEEVPS